jgi:hypothetical protein
MVGCAVEALQALVDAAIVDVAAAARARLRDGEVADRIAGYVFRGRRAASS